MGVRGQGAGTLPCKARASPWAHRPLLSQAHHHGEEPPGSLRAAALGPDQLDPGSALAGKAGWRGSGCGWWGFPAPLTSCRLFP